VVERGASAAGAPEVDIGPVPRPANWLEHVNEAQTEAEIESLRESLRRGRPFGQVDWMKETASRLGLEACQRSCLSRLATMNKVRWPLFFPRVRLQTLFWSRGREPVQIFSFIATSNLFGRSKMRCGKRCSSADEGERSGKSILVQLAHLLDSTAPMARCVINVRSETMEVACFRRTAYRYNGDDSSVATSLASLVLVWAALLAGNPAQQFASLVFGGREWLHCVYFATAALLFLLWIDPLSFRKQPSPTSIIAKKCRFAAFLCAFCAAFCVGMLFRYD